jgi:hypothetical protein
MVMSMHMLVGYETTNSLPRPPIPWQIPRSILNITLISPSLYYIVLGTRTLITSLPTTTGGGLNSKGKHYTFYYFS